MKKINVSRYVPAVVAGSAASLFYSSAAHAAGLFTLPALVTDDIIALMTTVLAGLALMWAGRKIIKTMNRS